MCCQVRSWCIVPNQSLPNDLATSCYTPRQAAGTRFGAALIYEENKRTWNEYCVFERLPVAAPEHASQSSRNNKKKQNKKRRSTLPRRIPNYALWIKVDWRVNSRVAQRSLQQCYVLVHTTCVVPATLYLRGGVRSVLVTNWISMKARCGIGPSV